jgi:hypothetical protein
MNKLKLAFLSIVLIVLVPLIYFSISETDEVYFGYSRFVNGDAIILGDESFKLSEKFAIVSSKDGTYTVQQKGIDINESSIFIYEASSFLGKSGISLDEIKNDCFQVPLNKAYKEKNGNEKTFIVVGKRLLLIVNNKPESQNYQFYCENLLV